MLAQHRLYKHNREFKKLERKLSHWYPLGSSDDSFRIDHGSNYFSFFKRLGSVKVAGIYNNNKLVGDFIGVLRDIPLGGSKNMSTWYLCDLKLLPEHRGNRLSLDLFMIGRKYLARCRSFYGISMNSGDKPNHILRLARRIPLLKMKSILLYIYSLNYDQMCSASPYLKRGRGRISFLSLRSKKDLILKSSKATMPLLHVQWGENISVLDETVFLDPQPEHQHMFCVPEHDPLREELENAGIETRITATIIFHCMEESDWKFVLTSEI